MDTSETGLEKIIVDWLRDHNGYEQETPHAYNKDFALVDKWVERFVTETQPEKVKQSMCFASPSERFKFFTRLANEITKRGVTDVLRKGYKFNGSTFNLYYPLPSELNPSAKVAYEHNIFGVIRQVMYSKVNTNEIDFVVFINGLPLATFELKNNFTGQTYENAIAQYRSDRDPKELLLQKKRCAVHFAVDDFQVWMCTILAGKDSWFLPFNCGVNGGAGNPVIEGDTMTSYLWKDILTKPTLSNIIENFAQVISSEDKKTHKVKETVIWPRYHQLDAVRSLLNVTKMSPIGRRFLIQHSAGSGKSNSITWLAYQLVTLLQQMVHENRNGVKLYDYVTRLVEVFGENAAIAFSYLLSTLFRDIIFRRTRHFPILNLFGEKGTGKTTLATSLQSFFLHGVDPPNLGVTSVPAMNDRVSQAVNTLVVLDEYKNDLDIRKIAYLKGLWGGGGQTKKNTSTDGMAAQTIVTTGVALCGQDKPTQDMALYTRVIFLAFSKTSFNQAEKRNYEDLVALCNLGLTHLTVEILNHRELFEKNFPEIYAITKRELATKLENETIHDRIFGNWVIPLATFRTLETVIHVPFSYTELFETAFRGIRNQNELAQESSEIADFWNMLQGFQTSGKCIEKAHYRIRYLKSFRPISVKEDIEFKEARPILYLNMAAVASLFNSRNMNATANRSNWSTIMSYLKSHSSYLGLKQDRFTILQPGGLPDYMIEVINGEQVRKVKVNRPKALCFDYLQLKDAFGLDLETEIVSDSLDLSEDNLSDSTPSDTTPPIQEDLPF